MLISNAKREIDRPATTSNAFQEEADKQEQLRVKLRKAGIDRRGKPDIDDPSIPKLIQIEDTGKPRGRPPKQKNVS